LRYFIIGWSNKKKPTQKGIINIEADDADQAKKIAKIYLSKTLNIPEYHLKVYQVEEIRFISKNVIIASGLVSEPEIKYL